jgi:hypothetical protein
MHTQPNTGGADDGEPYYRPFANIIKEIGRGGLHADLSKALAELTAAVVEHGKGGTLTLTIKLDPVKDSTADALILAGTCTIKKPTQPATSLFYGDEDGLLTRNDPRQVPAEFDDEDTRKIQENTRR